MALDFSLVTQLVSKPVLFDVLKEIVKNRIGGGWALAKTLDKNPREVEQALLELRSLGLVDVDGSESGPTAPITSPRAVSRFKMISK